MRHFALLLAVAVSAGAARSEAAVDNTTQSADDESTKQEEPCALHVTPKCMRSLASRFVDRLASDPHFHPLPGVTVSTDLATPSTSDSLDSFVGHRAANFIRSLTLTVRPLELELPFLNSSQILDSVITGVTGRRKGGNGLGLLALLMGGGMMAMMMAGLAAMAGKALMTSLTALMLAGLSALKGGHGGSKSTTYEIYAKPQHGHSSDHGW